MRSLTVGAVSDRTPEAVTRILGVPFSLLTFEEAVARVEAFLASEHTTRHVVLANAHTLNLAAEDAGYRDVLAQAALVLRDGVGVELAARLAGVRPGHNFVGTDFLPALLRRLAARPGGASVFLVGGREGVAARAAEALREIPGLRVAGALAGYGDLAAAAAQVRTAAPDVLLVALGNPAQERWIHNRRDLLGARVAIGVGALFDYLAGRVPRAPDWMLRLRAEWLFRLFVEPRRLWRRYVVGNPRFLLRVLRNTRTPE